MPGMQLEDLLSAIAGALSGGMRGYSWMEELEADERDRRDRTNKLGLDLMAEDAERMHRTERERISDERYNDTRRRENAAVTASLLEPNQEIDDAVFADLRGTPHEARVNTTSTLPSRTLAGTGVNISDPGGRTSRTWRPTAAQSKAMSDAVRKREMLATLPIQARRVAEANDLGIDVSASDLQTPEEKARIQAEADARAFNEFTRREDYQDRLIRRREGARRPETDVDPYYARDKGEYELFLRTHEKQQEDNQRRNRDQRDAARLDPKVTVSEVRYEPPITFEQWRAREKGRGPLAGKQAKPSLPLTPMQPMPSHGRRPNDVSSTGRPRPMASSARAMPQVGQEVTVRGQRVKVTKVNPDGTIEGVPVG